MDIVLNIEQIFPPQIKIPNDQITIDTHINKTIKSPTKQIVYIFRSLACAILMKFDNTESWKDFFNRNKDHGYSKTNLDRFLNYLSKYVQDNINYLENQKNKNKF